MRAIKYLITRIIFQLIGYYIFRLYIGGIELKKIFAVLLVISISISCLLIAIELNAFNINLYNKSFRKHNIDKLTGKDFNELEEIANDLILYLDGKESEDIMQPNFNNKEILHMEDVKMLFTSGKLIRTISVVLSLFLTSYFFNKRQKKYFKFIFMGLFSNWIILTILGFMIYFDFNKYFTIFHHIFFSNDLWILNPKTDLLIQMLPEDFFMNMASRIVLFFLIFLTLVQGLFYIIIKTDKKIKD